MSEKQGPDQDEDAPDHEKHSEANRRIEGGEIANAYFSSHDLREVFTRENTERRRQNGATLRRFLTTKQDKKVLQNFIKIREEYAVTNNNDVVIVWAKQMIDDGKEEDLHPELVQVAKNAEVPKRDGPFVPEEEH